MSTTVENSMLMTSCIICMDELENTTNYVKTECGHEFHTSCLMKNVSHNGFACPCCRDKMAEEVNDDDSIDDDDDDLSVWSTENLSNGPQYSDYALRGARWMFQQMMGEEIDDDEEDEMVEVVLVPVNEPVPSVEFISKKLKEQNVEIEDLVKPLLLEHEEYDSAFESLQFAESKIFGLLRIIISNYSPEA